MTFSRSILGLCKHISREYMGNAGAIYVGSVSGQVLFSFCDR